MIVDTHAHLDAQEFDPDRHDVIMRAVEAGVEAIVTVGCDLESSRAGVELAERYPWVYAAVGFHPHDAARLTPQALEEIVSLAAHPKVVAMGEVGLDFYRNLSPREVQLEAFAAQLDEAARLGLPVIVHSRQAHQETLAALKGWASPSKGRASRTVVKGRPRGVMHCFSGDARLAWELIEMGFFISFAGPLTFPKAHRPREVARALPLNRLLVETDCPYLTPSAHYGHRNEPAFLWTVAEGLAAAKETSLEEIASTTSGNAQRLFGFSLARKGTVEGIFHIPADIRRPA